MNSNFTFLGEEIETPLYSAEGSINGVNKDEIFHLVSLLSNTSIGAISIGSITLERRLGHHDTYNSSVFQYVDETKRVYNSVGLSNLGLNNFLEILPELLSITNGKGKPLIISISSDPDNKMNSIKQVEELSARISESIMKNNGRASIVLNTSCPNLKNGIITGYNPEEVKSLIDVLEKNSDLWGLKLPPYLSIEQSGIALEIAKIIQESKIKYVITSNSIPSSLPRNSYGNPIFNIPGNRVGMSGPATSTQGRDQLRFWKKNLEGIEIVSTLGVHNGMELNKRMNLGAQMAGGVSFLWLSSDWRRAVNQMLRQYSENLEQ